MNKMELIEALAEKAGVSKSEAERVLNSMIEVITAKLLIDEDVTITGFGTYSVSHRKQRQGVNPQNPSQKITIPAMDVPKFTSGKTLKDAVKNK
ncbi:HU family DNA-binding protein [Patescibacteria group bacterium]|nr:HU family DNA-binding protein [Patescibacteria group bacterium]